MTSCTSSTSPMASSEPLCILAGAEKRYARRSAPALGPLSLTVWAGEILGVRGPNGAGKSTLLGLLAGTLRPDGGEIRWGEGVRGCIGYVPQELSLYSGLTGLENLKFWAKAAGLPGKAIPARSRWLLEKLDLTEKGGERVSAYSGGMKRRLHLASALMVTPRLLLLDEPTAGADERSAELILELVGHMRGQGCGVVLTSHRSGELERSCTRLLTLASGRPAESTS